MMAICIRRRCVRCFAWRVVVHMPVVYGTCFRGLAPSTAVRYQVMMMIELMMMITNLAAADMNLEANFMLEGWVKCLRKE